MLLYILLFVLVVFAVPSFCRCFVGRIGLFKLERQCLAQGYGFRKRSKLWFLGSKYGSKADFAIETEACVYAVKLFGVTRKLTHMLLLRDGRYFLRRIFGLLLQVRFHFDSKPAAFPAYDFSGFSSAEGKTVCPMLLVHPAPLDIRLQDPEGECRGLCCGNLFAGMEIVTLKLFQSMLQIIKKDDVLS